MMSQDGNKGGGGTGSGGAGGPPGSTGSNTSMLERTQSQYQRKLARQRQLEMMEAAASGTAPSMQLSVPTTTTTTISPDFISGGVGPTPTRSTTIMAPSASTGAATATATTLTPSYDGLRSRETARRFLHDEEDDDDVEIIMSTNRTTTAGGGTAGTSANNKGISAKDLFERRNVTIPGAELNLMDHDAAIYKPQPTSIGQRIISFFTGGSIGFGSERDGIMTDDGFFTSQQDYRRTKKPTTTGVGGGPAGTGRDNRSIFLYVLLSVGIFGIVYFILSSTTGSNSNTTNGTTTNGIPKTETATATSTGVLDRVKGLVPGLHSHAESEAILREQNTDRFNTILDVLIKDGSTPTKEFLKYDGPEYMALRWISYADPAKLDPHDSTSTAHIAIVQRYALAVLYYDSYIEFQKHYGQQVSIGNMTDGNEQSIGVPNPGWKRKDHWMSSVGYCKWYGVYCEERIVNKTKRITQYDENGSVVKISLPDNNVYGSLPKELVAFDNLLTLDFSKNKLDGTFPLHMGRLFRLKYLYIQENSLSGSIPTDIGYLDSLREVYMNNNQFNSTIPIQMSELLQLKTLSLEHNQLTGNIPDLINCNYLAHLWLNHNNMSGFFPFELARMKSLFTLHINDNKFTGTIPPELGSNTNLISIHFENNQLSGTIPSLLFEGMYNLEAVHLDNNLLTGSIPTTLQQLIELTTLSLYDNQLNSTIPTEIGYMTTLQKLHLYNNKLSGSMPTEIGLLSTNLQELWLNDNLLNGTIPTTIGKCHHIQTLYLENNQLNGFVPSEISRMNDLKTLHIYGNTISGPIPDSVCLYRNDTYTAFKYFSADCSTKCKPCCDKCYV